MNEKLDLIIPTTLMMKFELTFESGLKDKIWEQRLNVVNKIRFLVLYEEKINEFSISQERRK